MIVFSTKTKTKTKTKQNDMIVPIIFFCTCRLLITLVTKSQKNKNKIVWWQHYMYMYGEILQILLHIFTNMCYQLFKKKKSDIIYPWLC